MMLGEHTKDLFYGSKKITLPHVPLLLPTGGQGDICCYWTHSSLQHAQTQEEVGSNSSVHSEPCP